MHALTKKPAKIGCAVVLALIYFFLLPRAAGIEGGWQHVLERFWIHASTSPLVWMFSFWFLYSSKIGRTKLKFFPQFGYPMLFMPTAIAIGFIILWSYTLQVWMFSEVPLDVMHRKDWLYDVPSWCLGLWGTVWCARKITRRLEAVEDDIVRGDAWRWK